MTTVVQIINLALKDAGVLGEGETASAEMMQDAFSTLKQMVGLWQVDGLMVYAQTTVSFSLTGAQSYTIGTSGDVNTVRPAEVIGAFWRDGDIDYPLQVLTSFEEYQSICQKSLGSMPEVIYYNPGYPLGTLYVWPVGTSGAIHLTVRSPLPTYATFTDDLSVPPEYELAIRFSLAEMFPAVYQVAARPDIAAFAQKARRLLKRNNVRIPQLGMPAAVLPHRYLNVESGEWI